MKKQLLLVGLLVAGTSFGQTILSENFESGLPGTWTQTTLASDGGWLAGTATSLSSAYFPISQTNATDIMATNDDACNCDKSADRLISPTLNLSGQTSVFLSVDVFYTESSYNGIFEDGFIHISTNGGSSWTQLVDLAGDAEWRTELIDLSAYAGQSNVKISFLYDDNGDWLYGFAIDNFRVYTPYPNDAKLVSVNVPRYALMGSNTNLQFDVQNLGSNTINNVTVDWNDGTSHSSVINTTIAPGATVSLTHPTAINYPAAAEANINVTITNVNGGADDDMSNNSTSALHNTVSELIAKNVVIEEGTGTWCGWCPRGAVAMEYMYDNYPAQFIGIAVHNGDPMTVSEYDGGAGITGFPGCNVDRALLDQSVSTTAFETYYNDRAGIVVPAALSIAVSGTGSSAVINGSATFKTPISAANYRLGVVIIEDNVTGTTSQYNQANYYSYAANNLPLTGAGHDWQQEPNPVPAASMEYDHVGRALLGTYNGQTGSVPASVVDGTVASYTFNYTVPATSNRDNMSAVLLLLDVNTGEIVHATKASIAAAGIPSEDMVNMNVYPNPASDFVTVDFEAQNADYAVSITDLAGRVVSNETLGNLNGSQSVKLSLAGLNPGNYLVVVSTSGASYNQMITVK